MKDGADGGPLERVRRRAPADCCRQLLAYKTGVNAAPEVETDADGEEVGPGGVWFVDSSLYEIAKHYG
jgi:hypothetical protein